MPDEDNPFMVAPKKSQPAQKQEDFGTDELVSFMVSPDESRDSKKEQINIKAERPHWESSGTPIWDRKVKNVDDEDYEVVDHK